MNIFYKNNHHDDYDAIIDRIKNADAALRLPASLAPDRLISKLDDNQKYKRYNKPVLRFALSAALIAVILLGTLSGRALIHQRMKMASDTAAPSVEAITEEEIAFQNNAAADGSMDKTDSLNPEAAESAYREEYLTGSDSIPSENDKEYVPDFNSVVDKDADTDHMIQGNPPDYDESYNYEINIINDETISIIIPVVIVTVLLTVF